MLCKPQIVFIRDQIFSILGIEPPPVFYIGGSDTLPPPLEKAADIALGAIADFLKTTPEIEQVRMVCFDEKTKAFYDKALEKLGQ